MKSFVIAFVLLLSLFGTVSAGGGNEKHTICHATGSATNPFEQITIAPQAVISAHIEHQDTEDIIPPFTYDGVSYSQNWDAEGQAIYNNGCVVPQPTVAPTEAPPTAIPTAVPTEVPTEVVTPEPTAEPTQEPTVEPTTAPTETVVTTPDPTAESTPLPTEASTPSPSPEATPTVVELPNTGSEPSRAGGVPLYAILGVATALITPVAIGVRKRA